MATRKAVLVGLNHYPDPRNNLKGCVNDVLMMSGVLRQGFGFPVEQMRVLTDERATCAAVESRLRWLVKDAEPGDVLVFHYSGHGSQVRDREGDEDLKDGLDEVICPYDFNWDKPFTDDKLHEIFKDLPDGVNLTVILDACHSGDGLRGFAEPEGPASPTRSKFIWPPPDIEHRAAPAIVSYGGLRSVTMVGPAAQAGLTRPGQQLTERALPLLPSLAVAAQQLPLNRFGRKVAAEKGAVLLAGCQSNQTSADAFINNDYHGAFTYSLCQVLVAANCRISYGDLVAGARQELSRGSYSQVPNLEPSGIAPLPALGPFLEAPSAAPVVSQSAAVLSEPQA